MTDVDPPANWTRIMCDGRPVFEGVLELPDYLDIETIKTATLMGVPVRVLAVHHVSGVRHIGVTTDLGDRP